MGFDVLTNGFTILVGTLDHISNILITHCVGINTGSRNLLSCTGNLSGSNRLTVKILILLVTCIV